MEQVLTHVEFTSQYNNLVEFNFAKDVTIVATNGQVKAHRIVLATAVPMLRPILEQQCMIDSLIILDDFDIKFICGWLNFLYTGIWLLTLEERSVLDSFVATLNLNDPITYEEVTPETEILARTGLMRVQTTVCQNERSINNDSGVSTSHSCDPTMIDRTSPPQVTTAATFTADMFAEDPVLHIPPPAIQKPERYRRHIYRCHICYQVFVNPREVQPHVDYCHPGHSHTKHMHKQQSSKVLKPNGTVASSRPNKIKCHICDTPFPSFQRLAMHFRNIHIPEQQSKSVEENSHNKSTKKKLFACNTCCTYFPDKAALSKHKRVHANNYRCSFSFCDETFASLAAVNRHMEDFAYSHIVNDTAMTAPFTCPICSSVSDSRQILISHILTHKTISNEETQLPSENETIKDQIKCHLCSKTFHSIVNYNQHQKNCLNIFPCQFCTKKFTLRGYLDKHMVDIHSQDHPQQNGATTSTPGKNPVTKSSVSAVRQVDAQYNRELQRRTCFATGCQLVFPNHMDLINHSKDHPTTLLMKCEICGELFKNRDRVLAHRVQHFGTGSKGEICGKTIATKSGFGINDANVIVID